MNSAANDMPSLSSSILERVRQMQPEAWARLVETFSPIVYSWCRSSGLSSHDAADVVQEVFSSVARGIGNFERQKSTGSFRSWLATITRNRVTDWLRRSQKTPNAPGGTAFLEQIQGLRDEHGVLSELEQSICESTLDQALPARVMKLVESEVEPKTWQAFWLATVDELPASEIAQRLRISVASVYQAKSRVLRRIRQRLSEIP